MIRHSAYRKYFYYLTHFLTFRKFTNILYNKLEYLLKRPVLKSFPYKVTIDPANRCNLRCPGCHTGIKHPEMIFSPFMKIDDYKKIFHQIKNYTLSIALYNWGEPFLNKDIFKIIAYTRKHRVGTTMHSNFNHFNAEMAEKLVDSGLTHLYLSIDGASQDVYSEYRVRGQYNKVLENIELLVKAKKRAGSKLPYITWKYLVFPFNDHEIEKAQAVAMDAGVDSFKVYKANTHLMDIQDEASTYKANPLALANLKEQCGSLWSSIYIGPDGTLFPCSLAFRESEAFSNILTTDLRDSWNNSKYQNARKMFSEKVDPAEVPSPCLGCKYALKANLPELGKQEHKVKIERFTAMDN